MRPINPATPNALIEEPLLAELDLFAEPEGAAAPLDDLLALDPPAAAGLEALELAAAGVDAAAGVVTIVAAAGVVVAAPPAAGVVAAAAPDDPPSVTAVFRQLESGPDWMVSISEKAVAPVLSFKAIEKVVPDGRSTFQVNETPVWVGNCLIAGADG